jgi:hypothetical protein
MNRWQRDRTRGTGGFSWVFCNAPGALGTLSAGPEPWRPGDQQREVFLIIMAVSFAIERGGLNSSDSRLSEGGPRNLRRLLREGYISRRTPWS